MTRIPLLPARDAGPVGRALYGLARRQYGLLPDNLAVLRHRPGVLWAWSALELSTARVDWVLPPRLRLLATFQPAVRIGCSWCVDFGSAEWAKAGFDPAELRAVGAGRYDRLSADERAVIAYADAATAQPPTVDDAMVDDLRERFGDAGVVELTYLVALENMRSRFNAALDLTAQGFGDGETCRVAGLAAAQEADRDTDPAVDGLPEADAGWARAHPSGSRDSFAGATTAHTSEIRPSTTPTV